MKLFPSILLTTALAMVFMSVSAQGVSDSPRDGAYDKVAVAERGILQYDHLREADVFWKKRVWRVIDVREKMNLAFKYPKEYFIDILRNHAIEGTIDVYDPIDDEFTRRMTPGEVQAIGVGEPDTLIIIDPDDLSETVEISESEFDPQKVTKFRLKEDWIFDEETSTMIVRIIGVAPVMEVIDEDGNYRGDQPLFWAYYPELREHLARYEVFNPKNSGVRLSWEDVMEMRLFHSYVIKEGNVYDRRIQDYVQGIDGLLESERVRMDIFNFEHDLWSY